ncbi:MAG: RNA methyltransferase [Proteobacteria bacterium]|nr:RNA methyltransferase [Pseudomonadota bacterium]
MLDRLDRIRVVLVETTHPGNIGAAARAMKTMGLRDLRLVQPHRFPDPEAEARASGAEDILATARVVASLDEAVEDCVRVVGASARPRKLAWPELDPRGCGGEMLQAAGEGSVALVFGRERTGLTNEELDRCSEVVIIPANPEYSSLNLGAAVQVLSYELRMAALAGVSPTRRNAEAPPATHDELERFYRHLEAVLDAREFLDRRSPEQLMRRIRRLYGRTGLDRNEVQILRGMLTALAPDAPRDLPERKAFEGGDPENT